MSFSVRLCNPPDDASPAVEAGIAQEQSKRASYRANNVAKVVQVDLASLLGQGVPKVDGERSHGFIGYLILATSYDS